MEWCWNFSTVTLTIIFHYIKFMKLNSFFVFLEIYSEFSTVFKEKSALSVFSIQVYGLIGKHHTHRPDVYRKSLSRTRVPPIRSKWLDHAPKFSKVVVTLVDCKNGLILKFGLNLKWRRAAEKSLNFSRTSELLTAFRAVSAV